MENKEIVFKGVVLNGIMMLILVILSFLVSVGLFVMGCIYLDWWWFAAGALLFGIFWHRAAMPEQELLAELKPIEGRVVWNGTEALAESQAHFIVPT